MPLIAVRNDLTKMAVDAIVNTASSRPVFGSGTDSAVYMAAGMARLTAARLAVGTITPGSAAVTPAFALEKNGVKYIIHAVYWNYIRGDESELATLRGAYKTALNLAAERGCASVAIPLLGAGNRGWPVDIAIDTARSAIETFLQTHEMQVYLVLFSPVAAEYAQRLFPELRSDVDDDYVLSVLKKENAWDARFSRIRMTGPVDEEPLALGSLNMIPGEEAGAFPSAKPRAERAAARAASVPDTGSDTFLRMLDREMEQKHVKPGDIYNTTSITKAVLSKLRCNKDYHLGKNKVIELAIILRLTPKEADRFLALADYAFNPSRRRDRIIRQCLADGVHNPFAVDEVLYAAGEALIFSEE